MWFFVSKHLFPFARKKSFIERRTSYNSKKVGFTQFQIEQAFVLVDIAPSFSSNIINIIFLDILALFACHSLLLAWWCYFWKIDFAFEIEFIYYRLIVVKDEPFWKWLFALCLRLHWNIEFIYLLFATSFIVMWIDWKLEHNFAVQT